MLERVGVTTCVAVTWGHLCSLCVCVRMRVCVCVTACVAVTWGHLCSLCVCAYACVCVTVCVAVTWVHLCSLCVCVFVHMCLYVQMHACVCVCMCVCICRSVELMKGGVCVREQVFRLSEKR